MKKRFALILALAMLLSLIACGNSETKPTTPSDPTQASTMPTEAPTVATEEPTEPTLAPTEEPTTALTEAPTAAPTQKPTVAPTTCSHNWEKATCTAPKTCSVCKKTEGKPAGHKLTNGICSVCKYDSVVNAKKNFKKSNYVSITKSGNSLDLVELTWTDEGYWYSSYYYIQGDGDPSDYIDYEGQRYFCAGGGGPHVEYSVTDSYVKFYNKEAEVSVKYALLEDGSLRLIPDANSANFPIMLLIQKGQPQHSPAEEPAECDHEWVDGTCVTPSTCKNCNQTGEVWADMHNWILATCTTPSTCTLCGTTEGEALGHDWGDVDVGLYTWCQGCHERYTCSCGYRCDMCTELHLCNHYGRHWEKHKQCCPHKYQIESIDDYYHQMRCWWCGHIQYKEGHIWEYSEIAGYYGCAADGCGRVTKNPENVAPTEPSATKPAETKPATTKPPAIEKPTTPPATEPSATDVLIISDTQTISNQTLDTDVYITSTGVLTFENVIVNGTVYCYGQLTIKNCTVNELCAYSLGWASAGEVFDGVHGKVAMQGDNKISILTITEEALETAFDKWGKK